MKTLKESLLADIDSTLSTKNPYEELYPLPTIKDFEKDTFSYSVKWQCPELIKPYTNEIASIIDISYIIPTGLECHINDFKYISVHLISKNGFKLTNLCVGDKVSNNLQTTQKECINFFKTILDNPETYFRRIVDNMKKVKQSNGGKYKYALGKHLTFDELFK